MLFRKTTAAVLAATLMLNGCTAMMWGMNDPFSQTTAYKHVDKDQIRAFGVVAKDNAQLEKGSLVMMGGKYWFVVNPEDSAKLTGILKAGLDKQFQMVEPNPRFLPTKPCRSNSNRPPARISVPTTFACATIPTDLPTSPS